MSRRIRGFFPGNAWASLLLLARDADRRGYRRSLRVFRALGALALGLAALHAQAAPAAAGGVNPEQVRFVQHLGDSLPQGISLVDEHGSSGTLGQLLEAGRGAPSILVFAYYRCPNLCTLVLNGLVRALHAIPDRLGRDYRVLTVSIDPTESPALALAKQRTYLAMMGQAAGQTAGQLPERMARLTAGPLIGTGADEATGKENGTAAPAWRFLTAREPAIESLTKAAGFGYQRDLASGEYAHPSGIVLLTPEGRISKYLFGIEFAPAALHAGLAKARAGERGSWSEEILLYCFHYDPRLTRNGPVILNVIRGAGVLAVLGIALLFYRLFSGERAARAMGLPEGQP